MRSEDLWALVAVFVPFSFVAIGGVSSIVGGIQRETVDVQHWVTADEFVKLFAVSRAAPGPGAMLVTLIGWKVAGWMGALVATLALFVPSCALAYAVSRVWDRYRGRRWHTALQAGLAPIGAGLLLAAAVTVFQIAHSGPLSWAVAGGSAVVLGLWSRISPIIMLAAGGAIFAGVQFSGL